MKRGVIRLLIPVLVFSLSAFGDSFLEKAKEIHKTALLVDGHNDLPWTLRSVGDSGLKKYDLNKFQKRFHTDIPRLRKGGLTAQFWSAYIPTSYSGSEAVRVTLQQVDLVHRMIKKYSDTFELALTSGDVSRIHQSGKIASMIGLEGGHSINSSLDTLRKMYDLGARYMTLAHNKNLSWVESCTGNTKLADPLNRFGEDVVFEMNRLGMFVDISHISARAMREVLAIAKAPVIASHSSAYALRKHVRNVPDDVLKMVETNGGVIMVNFYTSFISSSGSADVGTVVDHIDHIAKVAGIDHVGLGSDYDGVPALPEGLEDVSKYPNITAEMLRRGYSETDVRKVLGENLLRAFKEMEEAAKGLKAPVS